MTRSRSRSEETVVPPGHRPQPHDPAGVHQEPFEGQLMMDLGDPVDPAERGVNGYLPHHDDDPQLPPLGAFGPARTHFYLTPTGDRYHMSRNCRGLRNARAVLQSGRCPGCCPVEPTWEPGDRNLWSIGAGRPLHANPTHTYHTEMPEDEKKRYNPCHLCVILRQR